MTDHAPSPSVPSIADEFVHAQLGDARRTKRLMAIAERWSARPDACVPKASQSESMTEGTYRLLNNPEVSATEIAEAHVLQTCERIAEAGVVIVAHDSTEFEYGGEVAREGLGRLRKGDQGFQAHVALALTADGTRRPLGVVGFVPWVRSGPPRRKRKNGGKKSGSDYAKDPNKESARWGGLIDETASRIGDRASLIHVMDREADIFPLIGQMLAAGQRFVVRMSKNRVVEIPDTDGETHRLEEALARLDGRCTIDVPIARRAKSTIPATTRTFAPREARVATLRFSATTLRIKKPRYQKDTAKWLTINVVHVLEVDVPEGMEPVEWKLATSEPITTADNVLAVIEFYRTRWVIEEFFKALKTGCAVEKRQHESLHALLNATAICLPIAWQMLLLRTLARSTPEAPATAVLTTTQVEILQSCAPIKLDRISTVKQALYAVAALGGHLKNNGEPGWLVLGRGMQHLLVLEVGWLAARRAPAEAAAAPTEAGRSDRRRRRGVGDVIDD